MAEFDFSGLDVAGWSGSGHLCKSCAKLFRRFVQNEAGFGNHDKDSETGGGSQ